MGSIIRSTGTVFYSLLQKYWRQGFNGQKYVYSVISVIVDLLPGNTKNRELTHSWMARVRLFHPWAVACERKLGLLSHVNHDAFTCMLNVKGGVQIHMSMRMWKEGIDTSSSLLSTMTHWYVCRHESSTPAPMFICMFIMTGLNESLHILGVCVWVGMDVQVRICSSWRSWTKHYIFYMSIMTRLNETFHNETLHIPGFQVLLILNAQK